MRFWKVGLPLLGRELIERAARKRTYGARVLLAALLYGLCALFNDWMFRDYDAARLMNLGRGGSLLRTLVWLQFAGIYLFVPAMAAGLLTIEKERDSLSLLFLTRLGPWRILWEKYLGVLVPVFSLLLLTLPLAAVAYAYGGVTAGALWAGGFLLGTAALQTAAISLMCSAYFRTTVGAFFGTYCVSFAVYGLVPLVLEVLGNQASNPRAFYFLERMADVFPPIVYSNTLYPKAGSAAPGILALGVPAWIVTLLCLGLARFWLVRRAFVSGAGGGRRFLRWTDGAMDAINARLGLRQWSAKRQDLPGAHPIAWREMKQKALAQPRYLVRLLLGMQSVALALAFALQKPPVEDGFQVPMALLVALTGTLVVLALSVQAANTFVSERVHQTLDVLLTTPLSARQILLEKAGVMRRFVWVAAVPLLTVIFFDWFVRAPRGPQWESSSWDSPLIYLVCSLLSVAIYLPLVSWLSLWVGLRTHTRFRAILTALGLIVAWCAVPIFLGILAETILHWGNSKTVWVYGLSPLFIQLIAELGRVHVVGNSMAWEVVTLNYLFYASLLFFLKWHCLSRADFYLRRSSHGR